MANLKDLSGRIATLKNMQKVMRAMNLIATIKLRKLFRLQSSLELFESLLEKIAGDIQTACPPLSHPIAGGGNKIEKVHVVVFSADKGLCGPHNTSVHKALDLFMLGKASQNIAVEVTCIGKRGASHCKRKAYTIFQQMEIHERGFDVSSAAQLASTLVQRFFNNDIQQIHIIANYFVSTLQQDTRTAQVLPFPSCDMKDIERMAGDISFEPVPDEFLQEAGTLYFYYKLMSALFNYYLSEQSSRMTAMENATKNSEDLIRHYVKLMNRARQANITNDLIEIISGKEALKGSMS